MKDTERTEAMSILDPEARNTQSELSSGILETPCFLCL